MPFASILLCDGSDLPRRLSAQDEDVLPSKGEDWSEKRVEEIQPL
jgi:hypothetical protein